MTIRRFAALALAALIALCSLALADEVAPARPDEQLSPTTGLPTSKAYTPFAVQLDNAGGARPQMGLAQADVIYESEIQDGGYTRYTALFNDNLPEIAEPVRSARMMHADIATDWNATLIHYGGQNLAGTSVYDYFNKYELPHIDGIGVGGGLFYRDSKRNGPHNVICKLQDVAEAYARDVEVKSPLRFSADNFTQQGEDITNIEIVYKTGYKPGFSFNAEDGLYYRFYEREQQLDGTTGEPLTCSNIIIMYAEYTYYQWDDVRPIVGLIGTKNLATYFINGKCFEGYWRRESMDSATEYFDASGNPVLFKPGQTYIQILREGKKVTMN